MAWLAAVLLVCTAGRSQAQFIFLSESAIFNPTTNEVQFTIEFNQPPDFFTLDPFGRKANSFQYFIVGDPSLHYPELYDVIIRGEEITGNTVPVRNSVPSDPDPASGGWGAIRGSVPFSLDGNVVTFSTPWSLISDHSTDGVFAYRLETTEFGRSTRFVYHVVPEPAAAALMAVGGVLLCCLYGHRRRRNPQSYDLARPISGIGSRGRRADPIEFLVAVELSEPEPPRRDQTVQQEQRALLRRTNEG